jgi:hypothetical protein
MQEAFGYIICLLCVVWVMYMIAFRPEQWRNYCEENKARNRKLLGGGVKVGKVLWDVYRRSR